MILLDTSLWTLGTEIPRVTNVVFSLSRVHMTVFIMTLFVCDLVVVLSSAHHPDTHGHSSSGPHLGNLTHHGPSTPVLSLGPQFPDP